MTKFRFLIFLASLFYLGGCVTYTYTDAPSTMGVLYSKYAQIAYEGDLKPIDEVGIVTTDGLVKIKLVDGKPKGSLRSFQTNGLSVGGRYQLHLLPGMHELSLSFDSGEGFSISNVTKFITIAKGQVLHLSLIVQRRTWNVKTSDGSAALTTIVKDFEKLSKPK